MIHDWNSRFEGQVGERALVQGVDFDCQIKSMQGMIWTEAVRRGLRCTTRVVGNTIFYRTEPY